MLPTLAKETLSPAPTTCIMISLVELRRVGIVFSPDSHYIYIGNFTTRDISILRVDGTDVVDTGKRMKLPAQPASMRGGAW